MNRSGDCICCYCKYLSSRRAGRTARTVEEIRPLNFVNSKIVQCEGEKGDFDISKLPFPSFPLLLSKSW